MKRALVFAIGLLGLSHAAAETRANLCAAAARYVRADALLGAEVEAAFGKAEFTDVSDDCLYPLRVLRFASADVLLVQAGEPGAGCHGCGAPLSAFVIQRIGGGYKSVAKVREFAELGSHGAIAEVWPIEIGGDDAIAVESGGTFQGHTMKGLNLFAFHAGALVELVATPPIRLDADNGGVADEKTNAISVSATWFLDPTDKTALVVDYTIETRGASRVERAVWRLRDGKFALQRGHVPLDVEQAGGG